MKRIISFILLLTLLFTCSCGTIRNSGDGITVVTTCFPLYDFARSLIGDRGNVTLLLKPGQDNHSYEPSAKDVVKIKGCDLFLCIGGEDESWVKALLSGSDLKSVNSLCLINSVPLLEGGHFEGDGHDHSHGYDEHIWTSPKNAVLMVKAIADELISLFPDDKDYIEANLNEYLFALNNLDSSFEALSKDNTVIFGDRFPFLHLFDDYGLSYLSAYPGCSELTEPSASKIAELIGVIKEQNISTVFVTELSNKKIANTLRAETDVEIALLHSCTNLTKNEFNNGETYLSLMQKNVDALKKALGN